VIHRVGPLAPMEQIVLVAVQRGAPRRSLRRLRIHHRLPEDRRAVLEEGTDAGRRALGRRAHQRRQRQGQVGRAFELARGGAGRGIGAWLRWGWRCGWASVHAHVQAARWRQPGRRLPDRHRAGLLRRYPHLSPEWRLFVITGFLGGLTTFSSFSGESVVLLQRGDYGWALAHTLLHLAGSILLCIAGLPPGAPAGIVLPVASAATIVVAQRARTRQC
jgi:CrcB protein